MQALFLGSFPPRACGIATFTKDVVDNYDRTFGTASHVIAIDEPGAEHAYPPNVVARIAQDEPASYRRAAMFANAHPAAIVNVQHEYGLFGGPNGALFLTFLDALRKPAVVSMHTVLPEPSPEHLAMARAICDRAAVVVMLSQTGKDILAHTYGVDPSKIRVIHHGVPDVPFRSTVAAKMRFGIADRTTISTFGLISRGKGLEYGIEAMRRVAERHPSALYLILGQTHPSVRRHEGESYREELQDQIARAGLEKHVVLVDRYLQFGELLEYLSATDIYLTPYLNPEQIVSGTLAYAIGCGKAVVSTPYLYARELLAQHRGLLAPFRDTGAIGDAVLSLLDDPALRRAVERRAYRFGRQMTWPHVAAQYGRAFAEVVPQATPPALLRPA